MRTSDSTLDAVVIMAGVILESIIVPVVVVVVFADTVVGIIGDAVRFICPVFAVAFVLLPTKSCGSVLLS